MNEVEIYDLGLVSYHKAWSLQKSIQKRLIDDKLESHKRNTTSLRFKDVLLFVEHPHVYTLGKSGNRENLLKDSKGLQLIDAEFVLNDRGGDITYHGPGQIVCYPIIDLGRYFTDIHKYLRFLEEVTIRVCEEYGQKATRIEGLTGVWVDQKKVCAMGIRCSRWVTMHGFALNVNTDLDYFKHIVPCGISDKAVTSLSELAGETLDIGEVKSLILKHFGEVFNVRFITDAKLPECESQFSYICPDQSTL